YKVGTETIGQCASGPMVNLPRMFVREEGFHECFSKIPFPGLLESVPTVKMETTKFVGKIAFDGDYKFLFKGEVLEGFVECDFVAFTAWQLARERGRWGFKF